MTGRGVDPQGMLIGALIDAYGLKFMLSNFHSIMNFFHHEICRGMGVRCPLAQDGLMMMRLYLTCTTLLTNKPVHSRRTAKGNFTHTFDAPAGFCKTPEDSNKWFSN